MFLIFSALIATAAALSLPFNISNETSLQHQKSTRIPFHTPETKITLTFTSLGPPIPSGEIEITLYLALEGLLSSLGTLANEPITNNRFKFRPPEGGLQLAVVARAGHEISWKQLYQIIVGLRAFIQGYFPNEENHYQALNFDVDVAGVTDMGVGTVHWFPPNGNEVTKPSLSSAPGNDAVLNASKPITLTFDLFARPIPSSAVNAAFSGAITRIHPFVQENPEGKIPNNSFQYRNVGGSVRIGVSGYAGYGITWGQLNIVLRELSQFMNAECKICRSWLLRLWSRMRAGWEMDWFHIYVLGPKQRAASAN
ncbi:hypothetical protein MMC28_005022 [Mycoblastus sanguinarius]|nr:hypothetical protein [Mycoblastus sanguinarius]